MTTPESMIILFHIKKDPPFTNLLDDFSSALNDISYLLI